jgi:hypothetical protein
VNIERTYLIWFYVFKICIALYLLYQLNEALYLTSRENNNPHSKNLLGLKEYSYAFYTIDFILIIISLHWVYRVLKKGYKI